MATGCLYYMEDLSVTNISVYHSTKYKGKGRGGQGNI